jgi:hypothetical protein
LDIYNKATIIKEFAGATSLNGRKKQIKAALIKEFAGATSLNAPQETNQSCTYQGVY